MIGRKRSRSIWVEGTIKKHLSNKLFFKNGILVLHDQKKKQKPITYGGIRLSIREITSIIQQNQLVTRTVTEDIKKFFKRRYILFSLYDSGVLLDKESWYSVTPECIAQHHASRLQYDVVLDAFCGAGGNSIQLAMTCHRIIALDIDPMKISMARHNASIYGVSDRIEFICGDYFEVLPTLKPSVIDAVFLSPPWGGLDYMKQETGDSNDFYSFDKMMGAGGEAIFALAASITSNIAFYVPKQTPREHLQKCSSLTCMPDRFEVEENYNGRYFTALTAYYGELAETCT